MSKFFTTVLPAVLVLMACWGALWIVRRRRKYYNIPDSPVSPRWLNENVYKRTGDEP